MTYNIMVGEVNIVKLRMLQHIVLREFINIVGSDDHLTRHVFLRNT